MKWAEISDRGEQKRFTALSEALSSFGIENDFHFLPATIETFDSVLRDARKSFDQLRIGGSFCTQLNETLDSHTLVSKQVGATDALIQTNQKWWPRNFLSEGVHRALVTDIPKLNLSGMVFILGTGWQARAVIAALAKIGFSRFTISCADADVGEAFVQSLKRVQFDVHLQFVPREMITQLPSIHSVAVNTTLDGADEGILDELIYFNFLSAGGTWIDLSLIPENKTIAEEADAVNAVVESPFQIASAVDMVWAEACVARPRFRFDRSTYQELLMKSIRS